MSGTLGNIVAMKQFTFGTGKTWSQTTDDTAVAQTVTVKGLKTTDVVLVRKPTEQADLSYNPVALVTADDTLSIIFIANGTSVTATAEEEWTGIVIKAEIPASNNPTI
jgi:hypothetical protein